MPEPVGSPAWLEALAEVGGKLPERPGASATLGFVVTKPPGAREVSWRCELVDGRVTSVAPGPVGEGEVDLLVTRPYDDLLAELRGETRLDEAFMSGRAKVAGSTGRFMALLPVICSDEWRAACAELLGRTAT